MYLELLANELILQVFYSCASIQDVLNLASTSHRFHRLLHGSQRLPILSHAAEAQYGPIQEAIQLVTHNDSQPAHIPRHVPLSFALLRQILAVGAVAQRWEAIYPLKKWKHNFEDRRLLTSSERYRLRRAIYRLWLYNRAFHNRHHPRYTRTQRATVLERAELLHNWTTPELAEIEDVREMFRDVLTNQICPSNGTIQRKFRKMFPTDSAPDLRQQPHSHSHSQQQHQLLFNIHLNYPQAISHVQKSQTMSFSKYLPTPHHDPGAEGWGDEIPHYYVVEDMLKLDPAQILWLKDNAPLKGQVETYVRGLGEWFENNGETFGQTLEWVLGERGDVGVNVDDVHGTDGDGLSGAEEVREAVREGGLGIVRVGGEA